jgi:hypothetical protein
MSVFLVEVKNHSRIQTHKTSRYHSELSATNTEEVATSSLFRRQLFSFLRTMAAPRKRRCALAIKDLNEMGARNHTPKPKMQGVENASLGAENWALMPRYNAVCEDGQSTVSTCVSAPAECVGPRTNDALKCRRIWISRTWGVHFLLAAAVLSLGIAKNQSTRYE